MTKLNKFYEIALKNNIPIWDICPPELISISVRLPDGSMMITTSDLSMAPEGTTQLECLSHELGHCMTGSFYNLYSPYDLRSKHEYKANKWAIQKVIPYRALIKAAKAGCRERYEFAEYFDVSERFIQKAIDYHASQGNFLTYSEYDD